MEVFLSSGEIGSGLSKPKRRDGEDPVWIVITPVNPETKVPMTEQARCSELISAICSQLQEFGAMSFTSAIRYSLGWVKEAKKNGRVIIEGKRGYNGKPSAKGKIWELRTMTTIPPGVMLVDMEMNEKFQGKKRAREQERLNSCIHCELGYSVTSVQQLIFTA
jgi:hypothetical protein